MAAEIVVINILKVIFVLVGVHLALTKVLPLFKKTITGLTKDKQIVEGLTGLIAILILVMGGLMVIEFLLAMGNKGISYIAVIKPALDVIFKLEYYFKYIILGVIVVIGLKAFKRA